MSASSVIKVQRIHHARIKFVLKQDSDLVLPCIKGSRSVVWDQRRNRVGLVYREASHLHDPCFDLVEYMQPESSATARSPPPGACCLLATPLVAFQARPSAFPSPLASSSSSPEIASVLLCSAVAAVLWQVVALKSQDPFRMPARWYCSSHFAHMKIPDSVVSGMQLESGHS